MSVGMPATRKSSPIDDYLRAVSPDRKKALEDLRAKIRAAVPDAQECLSYGMPAFRVPGGVVAGFLATKSGCSYFPFSGSTLGTVATHVRAYGQTKSALHFPPEKPLPATLVRRLIKARLAEMEERPAPKAKKAARRARK